ncbi:hypothetical protein AC578_7133, partial [Pseudocercospora eumusae]
MLSLTQFFRSFSLVHSPKRTPKPEVEHAMSDDFDAARRSERIVLEFLDHEDVIYAPQVRTVVIRSLIKKHGLQEDAAGLRSRIEQLCVKHPNEDLVFSPGPNAIWEGGSRILSRSYRRSVGYPASDSEDSASDAVSDEGSGKKKPTKGRKRQSASSSGATKDQERSRKRPKKESMPDLAPNDLIPVHEKPKESPSAADSTLAKQSPRPPPKAKVQAGDGIMQEVATPSHQRTAAPTAYRTKKAQMSHIVLSAATNIALTSIYQDDPRSDDAAARTEVKATITNDPRVTGSEWPLPPLKDPDIYGISYGLVEKRMQQVVYQIECVSLRLQSSSSDGLEAVAKIVTAPSVRLRRLYDRLFGDSWKDLAESFLQGRGKAEKLLQGLIGAAVYEVVYSAQLPWDSPLAIFEKLGVDTLYLSSTMRACELAMPFESLIWRSAVQKIEDASFQQERIRPVADKLANELFAILKHQLTILGIDTSPRHRIESRNLRVKDLSAVFQAALVLKGTLEAAPQDFDILWIQAGSPIEHMTMMSTPQGRPS